MKTSLLLTLLLTTCFSLEAFAFQAPPLSPDELVAVLDTVYRTEQEPIRLRNALMEKYGVESVEAEEQQRIYERNHAINEKKVRFILDNYGWPDRSIIGERGNLTICNVIQHSDNEVRIKYLPMMRAAVEAKQLHPRFLVRAEDRIATERGDLQIYGGQMKYYPETQSFNVWPVYDPENINKRRAAIGLGSIEEHLKNRFDFEWNLEEQIRRTQEFEAAKLSSYKAGKVQGRTIAVTVDDLPTVGVPDLEGRQYVTRQLIKHFNAYKIPAIGFVNEGKLGKPDPREEEAALLSVWIEAGLDLGNHTYSHGSLNRTPLDAYQKDVIKGERITKALLNDAGKNMRYFRHPYLHTGLDLDVKERFEDFLAEHDYIIAPVTIDNNEWIYADAYRKAIARGDTKGASSIGADYIRYMDEVFGFYERLSSDIFEREPAQILLIHANRLNADYFDELAEVMIKRGYSFVSLDVAMKDPIYDLENNFIENTGISWLQRWSTTQGHAFRQTPQVPQWVQVHR